MQTFLICNVKKDIIAINLICVFICLSIYSLLRLISKTVYILQDIFSTISSSEFFFSNYIAHINKSSLGTFSNINGGAFEKSVNILKVLTIFTEAPPWVFEWVKNELLFIYLFGFLPLYIDVFNC